MPVITTVEDLRVLAKKRLPKMFYDYADTGSWTEQTYRDNETDFARLRLRQRVAVDMENRSLEMPMVGEMMKMPVAIAPVGSLGMQHADGEILACRAAHAFGTQFTLSTMSICSIEDVADHVEKPFWFQIYMMRDREFNASLIERAKVAGCSALVVTLDLQMLGQRHKDLKNGLAVPPKPSIPMLLDLATRWRWGMGMLRTPRRQFRNLVGHLPGVTDLSNLSKIAAESYDPRLSWDDIAWIKERWGGKLILKGILEPEDAERAIAVGADALIVSNHGGRQLDGALSSIAMLPDVVKAVGDKIEVHVDGGIRTGQDVLKAVALGAKGAYIGRAMLYGLAAMGQEGVTKVLEILYTEMDKTMAFCGHRELKNVGREILVPPGYRPNPYFHDA